MIYGEDRTQWCPQCGAEYREGFTTCADCGVRLTRERPQQPAEEPAPRDDGTEVIGYELTGWTKEQRSLLEFILRGDRIGYALDGDMLSVMRSHQVKVEEIIDSIEGEPIDER